MLGVLTCPHELFGKTSGWDPPSDCGRMALVLSVLREKMHMRQKRQKHEGKRHTLPIPGQRKANWAREDHCAHEQSETSGQHADLHPTRRWSVRFEPEARSQPRNGP